MRVALAGATGLTGSHCLKLLLENAAITQVISIGRRPLGIRHEKLSEVMLVDAKLANPVSVDAFICCLGTTIKKAGSQEAFKAVDFDLPLYLAKELKSQGCKAMALVSAIGASSSSSIFYSRIKGELENALKTLNFESLSILQPSLILGDRQEKRPFEALGMATFEFMNPLLMGALSQYKAIEASEIAGALIQYSLLKKPSAKTYTYNGIVSPS